MTTEEKLKEQLRQEHIERYIDQLDYWADLTALKKENKKLSNKLNEIKKILERN